MISPSAQVPAAGRKRALEMILGVVLLAILAGYVFASQIRFLDNDEYEHLHKAWMMTQGTIPYFSATALHMPLLEWVIAGIMKCMGESVLILRVMRLVMVGIMLASLVQIHAIASRLFGSVLQARLALLLLCSNFIWMQKAIEIRPDNIMVLFVLLSFRVLMRWYRAPKVRDALWFLVLAGLAVLGKQNALVFYAVVGVLFFVDAWRGGWIGWRTLTAMLCVLLCLGLWPSFRAFLDATLWHLARNPDRFSPFVKFGKAWAFNRTLFILFLFQVFAPLRLLPEYEGLRKHIRLIPWVACAMLFVINRPFLQEGLVMAVFMSIAASDLVARAVSASNSLLALAISAFIAAPALVSVPDYALKKTWTREYESTREILRISGPTDLVFDSYGRAIFRHHPLEPQFLNYHPRRFYRLNDLQHSGVKYLMLDQIYTPRLPKPVLQWMSDNFEPTGVHPDIYVRKSGG